MRPVRAANDQTNHPPRDAELISDSLMRQSFDGVDFPNRQNLIFSKLHHAVSPSLWIGPVELFIGLILAVSNPSKVAGAIIQRIAIPMSCLMASRRARAMKHPAYQCVDVDRRDFAKGNAMVANTSQARLQHHTTPEPVPAIFVDDYAIHRPHTSEARRLIARMPRHWTPFLGFGYRFLSHIALLQRWGQGMTEGGNQPSFPIYNIDAARSMGITVLAARV